MVSWLPLIEATRFQNLTNFNMENELSKNEQPCTIHSVSGSLLSKTYEIDFGGNLKCKIRVCGNELEVDAAMNGWGNGIPCSEISVVELQ